MFDVQIQVGKKNHPRFILSHQWLHVNLHGSVTASIIQIRRRRWWEVPPCWRRWNATWCWTRREALCLRRYNFITVWHSTTFTRLPLCRGDEEGTPARIQNSIYINMFLKDSPPWSKWDPRALSKSLDTQLFPAQTPEWALAFYVSVFRSVTHGA